MHRAWCRSTSTPSAPPTTPATATSGCAVPRGRRSCTSGVTASTASGRSSSPTAPTPRARTARASGWSSTGPARPTRPPFLSLPVAIGFMGSLLPGGWPELMAANHALALAGRDLLCAALGVEAPAPDVMLGSMAAVPLPPERLAALPSGADSLGVRCSTSTTSRSPSRRGRWTRSRRPEARRRHASCASPPSATTTSASTRHSPTPSARCSDPADGREMPAARHAPCDTVPRMLSPVVIRSAALLAVARPGMSRAW